MRSEPIRILGSKCFLGGEVICITGDCNLAKEDENDLSFFPKILEKWERSMRICSK